MSKTKRAQLNPVHIHMNPSFYFCTSSLSTSVVFNVTQITSTLFTVFHDALRYNDPYTNTDTEKPRNPMSAH